MLVGIDIGGTFTDIAVYDPKSGHTKFGKVLTTHGDISAGVLEGFDVVGSTLDTVESIKHGTTVVINALLERSGGPTALVTTKGFRDVLQIARGNRPVMFDLFYRRNAPLVPRSARFEVEERISADGTIHVPVSMADVDRVAEEIRRAGCRSVAVSFINSYANSTHEEAVAERLKTVLPGLFVSTGTAISRQWYEYERTATAVANAYVGPAISNYLNILRRELAARKAKTKLYLMGSAGGALTVERALLEPIHLVESGPVGGCIGAAAYGEAIGLSRLIAFDMGGTTAKCALVENHKPHITALYYVGGYNYGFPIRAPVLDIVEVGTGGGSIAWLDDQHRMRLGPKSAGSIPGPACYGRGGTEPTVTDANLLLGRINPVGFQSGSVRMDRVKAERAFADRIVVPLNNPHIDDVQKAAQGILSLATASMTTAIRRITIERGRDPREYVLFAYGGGGPLHAGDIARALHIPTVIVPPHAGVFSAVGMLFADITRERSRTVYMPLAEDFPARADAIFQEMDCALRAEFETDEKGGDAVSSTRSLELRYRGQSDALAVNVAAYLTPATVRKLFEQAYAIRYGHVQDGQEVEAINFRLVLGRKAKRPDLDQLAATAADGKAVVPTGSRKAYFGELGEALADVYQRDALPRRFWAQGPCIVEEHGSTTLIGPGESFVVGDCGELTISIRN